jgi:transposase
LGRIQAQFIDKGGGKKILQPWYDKAETGLIMTVTPIHEALENYVGQKISIKSTYRMLHRNGWRKVKPDTRHPKADPQVQEEYKKNISKIIGGLP